MAGTIDLLRHTKDLSLLLQTVNTLPWELQAATEVLLARLEQLRDDLKGGRNGSVAGCSSVVRRREGSAQRHARYERGRCADCAWRSEVMVDPAVLKDLEALDLRISLAQMNPET